MAVPDLLVPLSVTVIALALGLILVWRLYAARVARLEERVDALTTERRSQAATYGRVTEQFAPFMRRYPFEARNFRFLGSPVDGVQFEADRVVFVEFKAAGGRVTPEQDRIRRLVEERRVEWLEFRVDDLAAAPPAEPPQTPRQEPPSSATAPASEYFSG